MSTASISLARIRLGTLLLFAAASASAQARSTSAWPPPWKSGPRTSPVEGLIACSVDCAPRTACAPISMSPVMCMEGFLVSV